MTYNIEGLPSLVRKGRGTALKQIGHELAAMRAKGKEPDVVLIQEGFRDETWDLIDESGYPYVARGPRKGQRTKRATRPHNAPDAAPENGVNSG